MPVIKRSRLIDRTEYTIYGVDAEIVFHVIKGGVLHKLLNEDDEKIENWIFKSLNENERTSYIAASHISVQILKNVLGVDISSLYDALKNFENRGEFYRAYREHVVHQWRVFILGLYLLESMPVIKETLQHKFGEKFIEVWAVTALCHDIGYLMERGDINKNKYADEIIKLLNSLESNQAGLSVFCSELDLDDLLPAEREDIIRWAGIREYSIQAWKQLFWERDKGNCWKLGDLDSDILKIEDYYKLTTSLETKDGDRACFIDHGIASAAILFYLMERKEYWIEQVGNLEEYQYVRKRLHMKRENWCQACHAIAMHNIRPGIWDHNVAFLQFRIKLNTFKIKWKKEPLAFLLVLCDCLQEWGRPCRDLQNKLRKEMTSQDMHVILNGGKIYLCFPTDELAKSASTNSIYNRITQPIKSLLDCGGFIEMVEINDSEIGKYLDEVLWIEEYRKISTGNKVDEAYELYQKGRAYGNATKWEDGKRLHIDAAKLFHEIGMNDWASRSLGRAAVDALDLEQMSQAYRLLEEAMELEPWQGTANYYWILEHCIRKDESIEIIEKYFSQMLSGMQKVNMISDVFTEEFERSGEEKKFCLLWDKLILLFTSLLEKEEDWPDWSKSDKSRQYVLMAERNVNESKEYLRLAEMWYRKVGLESYAAWTKSKCLFLESNTCESIEQMLNLLKNILEEGKKILQTPGGPKDIVRFSIKVNSFFYNILAYLQYQEDEYMSEAKVYCSAIDTFRVSSKYEYKEQCMGILDQIEKDEIDKGHLLESIKNAVLGLTWLEKNKMKILLR